MSRLKRSSKFSNVNKSFRNLRCTCDRCVLTTFYIICGKEFKLLASAASTWLFFFIFIGQFRHSGNTRQTERRVMPQSCPAGIEPPRLYIGFSTATEHALKKETRSSSAIILSRSVCSRSLKLKFPVVFVISLGPLWIIQRAAWSNANKRNKT